MKRGAQSEHLGGLCGYGFGDGEDNIVPFPDNTYMSSGSILSFCTPIHMPIPTHSGIKLCNKRLKKRGNTRRPE